MGTSVEPPLFEYGIQTERSDIRAHVCVQRKWVCVFRTAEGIRAIERYGPPLKPACQPGVNGKTAEGWCVLPAWINDLRIIDCGTWKSWAKFGTEQHHLNTVKKGVLAVWFVVKLLKMGRFPLWITADEDRREDIQIHGTDIVVFARQRIQVKCDWRGADPNLYLQKAERNPLRAH